MVNLSLEAELAVLRHKNKQAFVDRLVEDYRGELSDAEACARLSALVDAFPHADPNSLVRAVDTPEAQKILKAWCYSAEYYSGAGFWLSKEEMNNASEETLTLAWKYFKTGI